MRIQVVEAWKQLTREEKKNLLAISSVVFFVLFSYPIIRSSTTALFLHSFGAKNSPLVWIYSVVSLCIVVALFNKVQIRFTIHKLFLWVSMFTLLFFVLGGYFVNLGYVGWAYPLFIWKESYIVIQIHMAFAFLNNSINEKQAKLLYGAMGAVGSIGGIVGGLFSSWITPLGSTLITLLIGSIFPFLAGVLFLLTDKRIQLFKSARDTGTNLKTLFSSMNDVKGFVFLIGAVIACSQFVINLANFKFNILFEKVAGDLDQKTSMLGQIYSAINGVSLIIQIFVVPVALRAFKTQWIHFFIPLFYLLINIICFGLGGGILTAVSAGFILYKGTDYSLFSASKEILYFRLGSTQKYAAKYLNDMIIYRFAKGLISVFLVFYQGELVVNIGLYASLGIWILLLFPLFSFRSRIPIS